MQTIKHMYEHLYWANHKILEVIKNQPAANLQIIDLFSHILFSERVWLTRLKGGDTSQIPIWKSVPLNICEKLSIQNEAGFKSFLQSLSDDELANAISYTNSKGRTFSNSVKDILTHVALHGQYHRGQINIRLRAEGLEPVNIDFITFVR